MNTIVRMIFGSHLYGIDTPESDRDYKGVFMPSLDDILLGRIPKNIRDDSKSDSNVKNTKDDKDSDMYSLHYFIKLLSSGETVAIDMIHAPSSATLESSGIWEDLITHKDRVYSKNMNALYGYVRQQCAKYSCKGSRLNAAKSVIDFLESIDERLILQDVWDRLPEGDYITKSSDLEWYEVCGKKFGRLTRVGYDLSILRDFYSKYGKRAQMAANSEGVDWKAVSHAVRVCYQVLEIVRDRNIVFPLRKREYIRDIKLGKYTYPEVSDVLDELMSEIEREVANSDLPDSVDKVWWDRWLYTTILKYYGIGDTRWL